MRITRSYTQYFIYTPNAEGYTYYFVSPPPMDSLFYSNLSLRINPILCGVQYLSDTSPPFFDFLPTAPKTGVELSNPEPDVSPLALFLKDCLKFRATIYLNGSHQEGRSFLHSAAIIQPSHTLCVIHLSERDQPQAIALRALNMAVTKPAKLIIWALPYRSAKGSKRSVNRPKGSI